MNKVIGKTQSGKSIYYRPHPFHNDFNKQDCMDAIKILGELYKKTNKMRYNLSSQDFRILYSRASH